MSLFLCVCVHGIMEIATDGETPYPGMKNVEVLQEIRKGYRMPRPDSCPTDLYQVSVLSLSLSWR